MKDVPNPESFEGVEFLLRGQPITKKMRSFLAMHYDPREDTSVLDKVNCWVGLDGVWHYCDTPKDWGYQQFVYQILANKLDVDSAIAEVIREQGNGLIELAGEFFGEPQKIKSVPVLDRGNLTQERFDRILDALQGVYEDLDKSNSLSPRMLFARKVLVECGRIEGDVGGPPKDWLEKAGDVEDQVRSLSVGGLAVELGENLGG